MKKLFLSLFLGIMLIGLSSAWINTTIINGIGFDAQATAYYPEFSDTEWYAQAFTPDISYNISHVLLDISKSASPTGNVYVSIRPFNSSGSINGTDLSTGSLAQSSIRSYLIPYGNFTRINLTTYYLEAGKQYVLVVNSKDSNNSIKWYKGIGSINYDGGEIGLTWESTDGGVNWGNPGGFTTYRYSFYLLGDSVSSRILNFTQNKNISVFIEIPKNLETITDSYVNLTNTSIGVNNLRFFYYTSTYESALNELIYSFSGSFNGVNIKTANFANYSDYSFKFYKSSSTYGLGSYYPNNYIKPMIFQGTSNGTVLLDGIYLSNENVNFEKIEYNATSFETAEESFIMNITYDKGLYSSAFASLIYNGTTYASSNFGSNGAARFSKSIDLPLVQGSSIMSFLWQITLYNGTSNKYLNSTSYNQTVNQTHLELCNATYTVKAMNFTAYKETDLSRVSAFDFHGTFSYWLGSGTIFRNLSLSNYSISERALCISPSNTYKVNAFIEYGDNNVTYISRNFFLRNESVSSATKNFSLYLLEIASATTFILKVQDINQIPRPNVYVHIQRYYPGTDEYKTVQIAKTDDNGKTLGFYKTETVDYRHIIKDENGTILMTTSVQKIFGETVPYTLIFTIGEGISTPWSSLENLTGMAYSLTFNKTTKIVSFYYADSDDTFSNGNLTVKLDNPSTVQTTICSSSSTFNTNTLTCNLSSYNDGKFTAYGYIIRTEDSRTAVLTFVIEDTIETLGRYGLFLAFFIILTASMLFLVHPIAGVWAVNIAVIFVNLIRLASFSMLYIFAMIAVSIIITAALKSKGGYYE